MEQEAHLGGIQQIRDLLQQCRLTFPDTLLVALGLDEHLDTPQLWRILA